MIWKILCWFNIEHDWNITKRSGSKVIERKCNNCLVTDLLQYNLNYKQLIWKRI